MTGRAKHRPEAPRIKPARQGDLDGLCGLYAMINALEFITARPPGPALQARLFKALTDGLSAPRLRKALAEGLNGKELIKAAHLAFPEHKKALGGTIEISRPLRRQAFRASADFVAALAQLIDPGDAAVVINFATPRYSHWTVVRAAKLDALTLKDSLSSKALPLDRYTIRRGPYHILVRETLLLRLRPLKRQSRSQGDP